MATRGADVYVIACNQIFKVNAQGQVTHVAGTGVYGLSVDGTPAATANFLLISSLSLDSAGNIYFLDNARVLEVVASTGLIKTVAGTGIPGYSGDGGPATSARIGQFPNMEIFADSQGDVFIADALNSRVREVVAATGTIATVAGNGFTGYGGDGGPATSAQLSRPEGVFVDGPGNIFIADTFNSRVREVVAATGIIQTVAGNGVLGFGGDGGPATSAQFSMPSSIFVDSSGDIFISDKQNNRIREVMGGPGGTIQTVAGNGSRLTSGCNGGVGSCLGAGGPATNAIVSLPIQVVLDASGNLFIPIGLLVEEVVKSTGRLEIFAANGVHGFTGTGGPATNAQLNEPSFASTDAAGNVYIADSSNDVVYELVAATGILKIVAGTGVSGFQGDGGQATNAELYYPSSVVVDGSGNLIISDSANNVIRKVDAGTGVITTVAGNGNSTAICSTSSLGDGGPATSASLCFPTFAAADSHGNIFIADSFGVIREVIAATGIIQTVAGSSTQSGYSGDGGPATSALLSFPTAVFVDNSGNIFIADSGNLVFREVIATTGIIQTIAGNGNSGSSGDGGPATAAEFFYPQTIWGDNFGNYYVTDFLGNDVRQFTIGGNIQTVAGNRVQGFGGDDGPPTSAELNWPGGAFVEPSGSLLIADTNNARVRIVGLPTTTALSASTNPALVGQPLTLTATVSVAGMATPIGSVCFRDNGSVVGTGAVNASGNATLTIASLAVGSHPITAQYFGTNYPGSVSSTLTVTIAPLGTKTSSTTLSSSQNPSVGGQSVTFTATVGSSSSGTPTGSMNFLDGTTQIGSGSLNSSAQAMFSTTTLTAGTHSITAQYLGDATFAPSTSSGVNQSVVAALLVAPSQGGSVTAGETATINLTMLGAVGSSVSYTLACSNLPANSSCAFTPNPVTPTVAGTTIQLMFSTHAAAPPIEQELPIPPLEILGGATVGLAVALGALWARSNTRPRQVGWVAATVTLAAIIILAGGCGSSNNYSNSTSSSNSTPRGLATITVTGTPSNGGTAVTTTVSVAVN